jgi:hypothetical protein
MQEVQEIQVSVAAHFARGTDGLHPDDHHFLTRGIDAVLALPLPDIRAWLSGIGVARTTYEDSEARTIHSMQQVMAAWLQSGS